MLRSGTIVKIKGSAYAGKSAYTIGKELGISKNTARKYIKPGIALHERSDRASKPDPYKPLLHELMADGIYNCEVLLEQLRETGYDGGVDVGVAGVFLLFPLMVSFQRSAAAFHLCKP
jgi:hypothetical protein